MLTKEQYEMSIELRRINYWDDDLIGLLEAALETRDQQRQMVDYMKSQENLKYVGVIEEVLRITKDENVSE